MTYYQRYYKKNKRFVLNANKKWRKANPDKDKAIGRRYYYKHRKKILKSRRDNRELYNKYARAYKKRKYKTLDGNINHRIQTSIQRRIRGASIQRPSGWFKLLGYSQETLKKHLATQFKNGMTWSKFLKGKIHIEHIRPIASFDFKKWQDVRACWALKNLTLEWAKKNQEKLDKLPNGMRAWIARKRGLDINAMYKPK